MKKDKEIEITEITTNRGIASKMRISLFDEKGIMISDRLVEQITEFRKGPEGIHKGPIAVEFNLLCQPDVDMAVEYLKKIKGDIPLDQPGEKKVKKDKTIDKMLTDKEPLLDLLKAAKAKGVLQEKLIDFLREYKFVFIPADVIEDMRTFDPEGVGKQITLRKKDLDEGYQYMVRKVKEAKEPMNDKYDFRLVFGIKILGDKVTKVPVYLWGQWQETLKIKWENEKEVNFKKVDKIYKFPDFMDYDDRRKWRTEQRKKLSAEAEGKEFEVSKFHQKFTPYIKGH